MIVRVAAMIMGPVIVAGVIEGFLVLASVVVALMVAVVHDTRLEHTPARWNQPNGLHVGRCGAFDHGPATRQGKEARVPATGARIRPGTSRRLARATDRRDGEAL